jgi:MerR family copper efflux transcriptional regulator
MTTEQGFTITQAAKLLGVSPKTIRRHIKDGRIPHVTVQGKYGEEYRIFDLPPVIKEDPMDVAGQEPPAAENPPLVEETATADPNVPWAVDLINDLQKTNLQLAAQLGAAQERIRELESRVQLLAAASIEPWWKRALKKLGVGK